MREVAFVPFEGLEFLFAFPHGEIAFVGIIKPFVHLTLVEIDHLDEPLEVVVHGPMRLVPVGLVLGSLVLGSLGDPNVGLVELILHLFNHLYPTNRNCNALVPKANEHGSNPALSNDQPNVLEN